MQHHQSEFQEIYESHIRQIHAYCLRRTDPADAQDAAAEVFVVLWRRWAERPTEDQLRPWIYGIARNVLANRHRSIRRQLRLITKLNRLRKPDTADPEAAVLLREEHQEVLSAMSTLSETHRETLRLVEWDGLTRDQVAQLYGVTRAAIDQRISRAYRQLGVALGAETPTDTGTGTGKDTGTETVPVTSPSRTDS